MRVQRETLSVSAVYGVCPRLCGEFLIMFPVTLTRTNEAHFVVALKDVEMEREKESG